MNYGITDILTLLGSLGLFLYGMKVMSDALLEVVGDRMRRILASMTSNRVFAVFTGFLITSVIQSSSATTLMVVSFANAGLLTLVESIGVIMGANIGTSITNTIVSLGHITSKAEFRRAFSASIVHDFFNIISVIILLPIQLATGFLSKSAIWFAELFIGTEAITFKSPIKIITKPTVHWISDLFKQQELINDNALLMIAAFLLLFISLKYLTKLIKSLVIERLEAFFDSHIFKTALRAMLFGLFITVMVQSSSITTSLVVPMAGAGILSLKQIFPYSLGANIGTTVTAILASLVSGTITPVAVAFSHLLFNICGILIIWPIPMIRNIPIKMAEWMAGKAVQNRIYPILYIIIAFFIIPLSLILLVR